MRGGGRDEEIVLGWSVRATKGAAIIAAVPPLEHSQGQEGKACSPLRSFGVAIAEPSDKVCAKFAETSQNRRS